MCPLVAACQPDAKPTIVHIETRQNVIVNRLNKTKVERAVDHETERVERLKKEATVRRSAAAEKVRTTSLAGQSLSRTIVAAESGPRARQGTRGREGRAILRLAVCGAGRRGGRGGRARASENCARARGGFHVMLQRERRAVSSIVITTGKYRVRLDE